MAAVVSSLAFVACAGLSTVPASASWGLPATDVSDGAYSTRPVSAVRVAANPSGAALVTWKQDGVWAARRADGTATHGAGAYLYRETCPGKVPINDPIAGVAPGGDAVVAWSKWENAASPDYRSIRAANGTVASGFGTVTNCEAPNEALSYDFSPWLSVSPDLAFSADGAATVVWTDSRSDTTSRSIRLATRGAGLSAFPDPLVTDPTVIRPATTNAISFPQVVMGPDGRTTVVWVERVGTVETVMASSRGPLDSAFPVAIALSDTTGTSDASDLDLAVAGDGTVTAVWHRQDGGNHSIRAARMSPDGVWATQTELGTSTAQADPAVAVSEEGSATVVWTATDGAGDVRVMAATRQSDASEFDTATALSAAGSDATAPAVASANGVTVIAWQAYTGSLPDGTGNETTSTVQARTRTCAAVGAFEDAVDLSAAGEKAQAPSLAVSEDGVATAAWRGIDGSNNRVRITKSTRVACTLSVALSGDGTGSVSSSVGGIDCGASCVATLGLSTTVTLTAAPATGSTFAGWGGACSGTATTCAIAMSEARSVTATFDAPPAPSGDSGGGTPTDSGGGRPTDSTGTLPRTPRPIKWKWVPAERTLTARFTTATGTRYTITAKKKGIKNTFRGKCRIRNRKATCTIRLRTPARWTVSVTPKIEKRLGTPAKKTILVRAARSRF